LGYEAMVSGAVSGALAAPCGFGEGSRRGDKALV